MSPPDSAIDQKVAVHCNITVRMVHFGGQKLPQLAAGRWNQDLSVNRIPNRHHAQESGDEQMDSFVSGNCRNHTRVQMQIPYCAAVYSCLISLEPPKILT